MSVLHGFEQTRQRRIDELDAALHEYIHTASGARLCWLEREDENKSFCAAFRTLPFDDYRRFFTFWSILFSAARSTSRSKSRLSN